MKPKQVLKFKTKFARGHKIFFFSLSEFFLKVIHFNRYLWWFNIGLFTKYRCIVYFSIPLRKRILKSHFQEIHKSLWFKGLALSIKNRWEFCQLLLRHVCFPPFLVVSLQKWLAHFLLIETILSDTFRVRKVTIFSHYFL